MDFTFIITTIVFLLKICLVSQLANIVNARDQTPQLPVCAEGELCQCYGTVYYMKKIITDSVSGETETLLSRIAQNGSQYPMKEVSGLYHCSAVAFFEDSLKGGERYCVCKPAELLDHPLCAPSGPSVSTSASSSSLRVAVGFYGLTQSLRLTLPTFRRHIFEVLARDSIASDVFSNTILLPSTGLLSSKLKVSEDKDSFESDEYDLRLMRPCAITLTPLENIIQEDSILLFDHLFSRKNRRERGNIASLLMTEPSVAAKILEYTRVGLRGMIETYARLHAVTYDAIIVLRPDTVLIGDIDISSLLKSNSLSQTHLYVPNIYDSQDRVGFGSSDTVLTYLCLLRGKIKDNSFVSDVSKHLECRNVSTTTLEVKKSAMEVVGIKKDRRLPNYDIIPKPPSLTRRLCGGPSKPSLTTRVAIGFYGLSRNLRLTLPTFKKHVFEVFDRHNIVYDVFWSTVTAPVLVSNRSNEWSIEIDEYDVRLMRPCVASLVPMYKILNETKFDYSHMSPHYHYKDGFSSVRNIFCSLETQKILDKTIRSYASSHQLEYDAVLTLRPDTAVVRDIDLAELLTKQKFSNKHIYLPNFAHFKGVNDRAAFGSPSIMSVYLNRLDAFKISLASNTDRWIYNTETFLKNYLKEKKIPVIKSTIRVIRVRADGKVPFYDSDTTVMYMSKKEIQNCQISVVNQSSGEKYTVLDTTIC